MRRHADERMRLARLLGQLLRQRQAVRRCHGYLLCACPRAALSAGSRLNNTCGSKECSADCGAGKACTAGNCCTLPTCGTACGKTVSNACGSVECKCTGLRCAKAPPVRKPAARRALAAVTTPESVARSSTMAAAARSIAAARARATCAARPCPTWPARAAARRSKRALISRVSAASFRMPAAAR